MKLKSSIRIRGSASITATVAVEMHSSAALTSTFPIRITPLDHFQSSPGGILIARTENARRKERNNRKIKVRTTTCFDPFTKFSIGLGTCGDGDVTKTSPGVEYHLLHSPGRIRWRLYPVG